jgi:hypothetical protein
MSEGVVATTLQAEAAEAHGAGLVDDDADIVLQAVLEGCGAEDDEFSAGARAMAAAVAPPLRALMAGGEVDTPSTWTRSQALAAMGVTRADESAMRTVIHCVRAFAARRNMDPDALRMQANVVQWLLLVAKGNETF